MGSSFLHLRMLILSTEKMLRQAGEISLDFKLDLLSTLYGSYQNQLLKDIVILSNAQL